MFRGHKLKIEADVSASVASREPPKLFRPQKRKFLALLLRSFFIPVSAHLGEKEGEKGKKETRRKQQAARLGILWGEDGNGEKNRWIRVHTGTHLAYPRARFKATPLIVSAGQTRPKWANTRIPIQQTTILALFFHGIPAILMKNTTNCSVIRVQNATRLAPDTRVGYASRFDVYCRVKRKGSICDVCLSEVIAAR